MKAPPPGRVIDRRFEVHSLLGEGATGVVLRAKPLDGGPDIALKLLDPELLADEGSRRRFAREARALSELRHPNVIAVVAAGATEESAYLATELCEGETLDRLLHRGPPAPSLAEALAGQLLEGLSFVHQHGIVHRDLKPQNVFLATRSDGSSVVKLLDFGLAKFGDRAAWGPGSILTATGVMLGTPGYMAPEQAFGGVIDARVDVYALGAVVFELFAGRAVFLGEDPPSLLRAHALEPVPQLASVRSGLSVRPELDAWLARALGKTPHARFADGREMQVALKAVPSPLAWLDTAA